VIGEEVDRWSYREGERTVEIVEGLLDDGEAALIDEVSDSRDRLRRGFDSGGGSLRRGAALLPSGIDQRPPRRAGSCVLRRIR